MENIIVAIISGVLALFSSIIVAIIKNKNDRMAEKTEVSKKYLEVLFRIRNLTHSEYCSKELIDKINEMVAEQEYQIYLHPEILQQVEKINGYIARHKKCFARGSNGTRKLRALYWSLRNMISCEYNRVRKILGYSYTSFFEMLAIRFQRLGAYTLIFLGLCIAFEIYLLLMSISQAIQVIVIACLLIALFLVFLLGSYFDGKK